MRVSVLTLLAMLVSATAHAGLESIVEDLDTRTKSIEKALERILKAKHKRFNRMLRTKVQLICQHEDADCGSGSVMEMSPDEFQRLTIENLKVRVALSAALARSVQDISDPFRRILLDILDERYAKKDHTCVATNPPPATGPPVAVPVLIPEKKVITSTIDAVVAYRLGVPFHDGPTHGIEAGVSWIEGNRTTRWTFLVGGTAEQGDTDPDILLGTRLLVFGAPSWICGDAACWQFGLGVGLLVDTGMARNSPEIIAGGIIATQLELGRSWPVVPFLWADILLGFRGIRIIEMQDNGGAVEKGDIQGASPVSFGVGARF